MSFGSSAIVPLQCFHLDKYNAFLILREKSNGGKIRCAGLSLTWNKNKEQLKTKIFPLLFLRSIRIFVKYEQLCVHIGLSTLFLWLQYYLPEISEQPA